MAILVMLLGIIGYLLYILSKIIVAQFVLSILIAFKAAGKIFRIGVLMTGNPPRLKEILGWLREK